MKWLISFGLLGKVCGNNSRLKQKKMQHVTRETAQLLENIGYPKPNYAPGQVWYGNDMTWTIANVSEPFVDGVVLNKGEDNTFTFQSPEKQKELFAPTAPDLLMWAATKQVNIELSYSAHQKIFYAEVPDEKIYPHENPAEAVAAVLIQLLT